MNTEKKKVRNIFERNLLPSQKSLLLQRKRLKICTNLQGEGLMKKSTKNKIKKD